MTRRLCIPILLASLLLFSACATGPRYAPGEATEALNPTITAGSYIEDGQLLTLIIGTRAAKQRAKDEYMPLEFALAIKGIKGITLTRESFTLVDEAGKRYPAVGPQELQANYHNIDLDRRLGDILPISNTRFISYNRIPSNFSPGFDDSVDRPRLNLPRYNWAYDFIYFPRPTEGVRGHRFELHVTAPELPHEILIKFKVR